MAQSSAPIPQLGHIITWARSQGVQIDGVEPVQIKGRGMGIRAQRNIKAGEEIVRAPVSTLLSIKSVPRQFRESHGQITANGLLASFLAFGRGQTGLYADWISSWPSFQSFADSLPMLWPTAVRETLLTEGLFPPAIGGWRACQEWHNCSETRDTSYLQKQESKLCSDWSIVSTVFPEARLQDYTYYWCIVNTRSFYWESPDEELPEDPNDRIALVPLAEYFNHCDRSHGCVTVSFDAEGFAFTSDRDYDSGEELCISYGTHNNDFLLTEYGFILDRNQWDCLPIDDMFGGDRVSEVKKKQLKDAGYWGNYILDSKGVCHRTQVAVRSQTTNLARWKQFVSGKGVDQAREENRSHAYIVQNILRIYYEEADRAIKVLDGMGDVISVRVREILINRWHQIQEMVRAAFKNGIKDSIQTSTNGIFDLPGG